MNSQPRRPRHTPIKHTAAALAVLICAHGPLAWAAPAAPSTNGALSAELAREIPTDPELTRGQLANGLSYSILPHFQPANRVELRLVVRTGSVAETEKERGLAHFIEHMVFNGTAKYPKNEIINILESMGVQFGADLNAYTGFNETVYILPIPLDDPDNLEKGISMLEQLAFHASLTTKDINEERGVIVEEWRASSQSPNARQNQHNLAVLAKGSAYANRMPIGSMDVVRRASPETIRQFYKRWYRPDLMSVVVVGDINTPQTIDLLNKHFGAYAKPSAVVAQPNLHLPNNTEPQIGVFRDKALSQSTVSLFQKETEDFVALNTVASYVEMMRGILMTTMVNQRLQTAIESGDAPYLQSYVSLNYLGGFIRSKQALQWMAVAAPAQELASLRALNEEAARILQHGFTETELARAKRELLTRLNNDSNNFQKATEYVRGITEAEPLPPLAWERSAQDKYVPLITLDEVNQLARRYIRHDNKIALINTNNPNAQLSNTEVARALMSTASTTAYQETIEREHLLAASPPRGKIIKTESHASMDMTTWTLDNGVVVHFRAVPNNDGPIVFSGLQQGGYSLINDADWRSAQWGANGLLETGVNGLSKTQVSRILTGKDISVGFEVQDSYHGVQGKFNVKDAETAMQYIYSLITGVNADKEAFERYKKRVSSLNANASKNRSVVFEQALMSSLERNNPRFQGLYATDAALASTQLNATFNAYRQLYGNANTMQFTFVGNAKADTLRDLVEQYLGALPSNVSATPAARDLGYRSDYSNRQVMVRAGSEQLAHVRLLYGGSAPFSAQNEAQMSALAHVVNLRLLERLREKEAGVYSPYVGGSLARKPYEQFQFVIDFDCAPAKVNALIRSVDDELARLRSQGIPAEDLQKFKQAEYVSGLAQTGTNEYWVDLVQSAYINQTAIPKFTEHLEAVMSLTPQSVQQAAQTYLSKGRVTAILLPE